MNIPRGIQEIIMEGNEQDIKLTDMDNDQHLDHVTFSSRPAT